jgi:hypothetical protein
LGGARSSLKAGCNPTGPEIDLPLIVGVTPGVSDEEAEEDDVSGPDDELTTFCLTALEGTSLRVIDLAPSEPMRVGRFPEMESNDGRGLGSSLIRESWDDRGVAPFSE